MELNAILSFTEMAEFNMQLRATVAAGAQAFHCWFETRGLLVIGLVQRGELEFWFACPAANRVQAIASQAIVMHGLAAASETLGGMLSGAKSIASDVIKKASH
jgi:hypothetical protein